MCKWQHVLSGCRFRLQCNGCLCCLTPLINNMLSGWKFYGLSRDRFGCLYGYGSYVNYGLSYGMKFAVSRVGCSCEIVPAGMAQYPIGALEPHSLSQPSSPERDFLARFGPLLVVG